MLLAVDIGNSAIKFGLFDHKTLTSKFSIPTIRNQTAAEVNEAIGARIHVPIDSVIACSVVPDAEPALSESLIETTGVEPVFVRNDLDLGLIVSYTPLDTLGTDRLVAAYAAVEKYGAPCIVCSFGTATTIDVVSDGREFLGGVIAPGLDAMNEGLQLKAPRLPTVEIEKPERIVGNSTAASIRSGVYYGYVAMIEGIITRIRSEAGISRIICTGGNSVRLGAEFTGLMTFDENLTLSGLQMLGERL